MTTLAELADSVYTITNRPDLTNETRLAIQTATLKEHAAIDYTKDLVSVSHVLDNSVEPLNYRYLLTTGVSPNPTVRKIRVIREIPADSGPLLPAVISATGYYGAIEFTERALNSVFDSYSLEHSNYYYFAGGANLVTLVAERRVDNVAMVYYRTVNVSLAGYSSWIADQFPYVIWSAAAAEVFQAIGRSTEAKSYRLMAFDHRNDVIRSNVTEIG